MPKFNAPQAQTVLAAMAMAFMGALGVIMAFFTVPEANHDYIVFILGALSGALTVGGVQRISAPKQEGEG